MLIRSNIDGLSVTVALLTLFVLALTFVVC